LDELFQRVVTLVKERFGYYHVHVYQIDPEQGDLVLAAGYGEWGRIMKERGHRIPIGTGLTGTAAQAKEPVLVADVSERENWLPNPLLANTKSELAVPIIMGDEVLGVLDVQDDKVGGLTEDAQVLLLGLCGQIATAIQNTRLLQETQEALADANMLYETSQAISTVTDRQAVIDIMVERIVATNVDRCEILLYEQRERGARFVEVMGSWVAKGQVPQRGTRYRLSGYPLADIVQQLGEEGILVIGGDDVARQAEPVREWFAERKSKALALVPLKTSEEYIGFLSIERHRTATFGVDAIRFFGTLANQSAVALRNIQLIEQSQSQLYELQKSYDDVARLADTIRQLSSPVIQVWEDVLVLPLVGAIDSRRATRIMEDLLTGITHFQAEQVIIDITGVPVMDTTVANYLLQTIKAAGLLGARCMLVGINSEMAQTIVGLGLDLSNITTYSNLRAGIQAALQSIGFAITPLSLDEGEALS
jgi:anti-anti-sigma factor